MTHRRWLIALVVTLTACGQGVFGSDSETSTTVQPDDSSTTIATTSTSSSATVPSSPSDTTGTSEAPTTSTVPSESEQEDDMTEPLPGEGDVPNAYLDSVLADAADRTGADASDLSVARADAVTWRDGSLGCPEPGMAYTQALVPGYWVEIQAGETILDYRLNADGAFRLCESAGLVVPDPLHKGDPVDPGS